MPSKPQSILTPPIFEIENLICAYANGNPVLSIDHLEIPRGKLVFVIGMSGIGKSTFIETLGFMNRTIAQSPNLSIKYAPRPSDEPIEIKGHWNLADEKLSAFRRGNFSFIFQNTNLMPNFTAGENMMFSLLLQNMSISESKDNVLKVMEMLSLEPYIFDKGITELSGGQRQRLAFVRAITAEFQVLFGDEPTGNLDEKTAGELMIILKEILENDNKTGIIVSHDLDLALKFADIIIPITEKSAPDNTTMGEINRLNIIEKKSGNWYLSDDVPCANPRSHINGFLKKHQATI